jgi:outer membrane protein OmpA-like peptidoglycan-associated protein
MLSLWGSEPSAPGVYLLALNVQISALIPTSVPDTDVTRLRGSTSSFGLSATLGVWQSIDFSAALGLARVSVESASEMDATRHRAALGELRLIPRFRLWGTASGSGVAVVLPVSIPTGARLYSDAVLRVEPRLAVTATGGSVSGTLNAAYVAHVGEADLGAGYRNFARAGVGLELAVVESWSVLGEVSGRWLPDDRALTSAQGWSSEAHLAGRYRNSGWAVQVGAGTGLSGALLEPAWRMLASVSFSSGALPVAADLATVPEQPAHPEVSDYSNETADWEASAKLEENASRQESPVDAPTPPAAAPLAAPALPPATTVQRETTGALDASHLPAIGEVLHFAPNQMRLDALQLKLLDRVATQMRSAPPNARLIVEGHCDTSGPGSFNSRLSLMRASTVRYHLLNKGIHWRRITIRAFGALRPIQASDPADARAQNRRVEFRWNTAK